MHAKQYIYAIIITSGAHALIFSGLFQYILKHCINLHLRRVYFSICEMVIFGQEMSRMSVLFMTSHAGF